MHMISKVHIEIVMCLPRRIIIAMYPIDNLDRSDPSKKFHPNESITPLRVAQFMYLLGERAQLNQRSRDNSTGMIAGHSNA
jgi:hypothetical protein